MDRLQFLDADRSRRRCVACGHEDDLEAASSQAPRNRLDGALKAPDPDAAVQTVRILGGADSGSGGSAGDRTGDGADRNTEPDAGADRGDV